MATISSRDKSDALLTIKEAVSVSTYSPTHLTRLAKSGKIKAEHREGKWLLEPRSLERYLGSARGRRARLETRSPRQPVRLVNHVGYSAAWTVHQANIGPFNLRSLLESIAIAGCSVLVGLLVQGSIEAGLSTRELYEGGRQVVTNVQERYIASLEEAGKVASVITAVNYWQQP